MSLMTEKLSMMRGIIKLVKEAMEKTKQCPPTAFCFKGDKFFNVGGKFDNDDEKYGFYRMIGAACRKEKCDFVMLINDAAMRSFEKHEDYKDAIDNYDTEAPLSYPKSMRTECIILVAYEFATDESKVIVQPYKEENGAYGWQQVMEIPQFDGAIIRNVKEGFNFTPETLKDII